MIKPKFKVGDKLVVCKPNGLEDGMVGIVEKIKNIDKQHNKWIYFADWTLPNGIKSRSYFSEEVLKSEY